MKDDDLDNYSITTDAEESVFFLQLCALFKKKILMQVRDQKTLGIDTIFPVLLILVGLALSTISFIKNGVSRDMSPFIYPGPFNFFYNGNSALVASTPELTTFFTDDWKGMNASVINLNGSVPIDVSNSTDLLAHVE